MNLADIREYVQKTSTIISTVAGMQVIICNKDMLLVADSTNKNAGERPEKLSSNSILVNTVKSRKMVIATDCQNTCEGCFACPKKKECDVNSIICMPIMDGTEVLGGIGIYAHEKEDINRLIEKK